MAGVLAVSMLIAALVIGVVPVRNGRVQDCGTPLSFLATGRLDVYPDANGTVRGPGGGVVRLTPAERDDAFNRRCSQRVGSRMAPAAALAAGALPLALLAIAAALGDLIARWRSSDESRRSAAPPPLPPIAGEPIGEPTPGS